MIDVTLETKEIKLWIFDYDNEEWERVRKLCLEEDNWLRENYLPHRCKVSDHKAFFIAYYLDGRPMMFGGIKEYNNNVARAFNRMYAFPYVRSVKKFKHHHNIMINTILPALETAIDKTYNLLFVSMQMRERTYKGNQKWWEFWKKSWFSCTQTEWKDFDGLVQTYPADNASCYQNIVYREKNSYTFKDWNPKHMSFSEYDKRFVDV